MGTEWILVTLITPESHGAWIVALRAFLVDRGTVFVSLGTSSLVVRRMDFTAATREADSPRQSETFYRIRAFDGTAVDALLSELPLSLLPQLVEEAVAASH